MHIKQAIEILEEEIKHPYSAKKMARPDALKLGSEALELILRLRAKGWSHPTDPLPGETEDYCKLCGIAHSGIECPDRGKEK